MSELPVKNKDYEMIIEDFGNDGEGIGHIGGVAVFVKDAAKGDRALVRIIKVKKNLAYGRLMEILSPSPDRCVAPCGNAKACGGCSLMHISYEKQLIWKQEKVKQCLSRIGKIDDPEQYMEPIVGLAGKNDEDPLTRQGLRYRNKAQFPLGKKKDGSAAIGFYGRHSHTIVDTDKCLLQAESFDEILTQTREFLNNHPELIYEEETGNGLLRHLVLREGKKTGQIQICLVVNGRSLGRIQEELVVLLSQLPGVRSIVLNVNTERTNRILGDQTILLWGSETIEDEIGGIRFSIGARSFYQVNPVQTNRMYRKALDYAGLTGGETVWDLYCGIGTISLFLAQKAKQVFGVEIVPQAIEDARKNAALNGITNATFFTGKAEEVLPEQYEKNGIYADVIVVDPPRKGCDPKAIETMLKMRPERIVYVSCDPATLARDIRLLSEGGYALQKACAFDNFCQSTHVETVVLLNNKFAKAKDFVQIGIDAEDYYRIKDSEKDTDE